MAQAGTVERILDTAEVLFAQKGFAETSLRAITSKAGVNLAAVNYHFGSKEALIQAVFERFLRPFCTHLEGLLEELESVAEPVTVERLLATLSESATEANRRQPQRVAICLRRGGRAHNQAQGHLPRYPPDQYAD